jgi:hypothetical protein
MIIIEIWYEVLGNTGHGCVHPGRRARAARIRRKVEADPSKPQVIKMLRGAGYIFSPS